MMDERKSFLVKHLGLRGIAIFEAAKGALALLFGIILLIVRHRDIEEITLRILRFLHLNPDHRLYRELAHAVGRITPHAIWLFLFAVIVYALIRFAEAIGLWLERAWAEWFAIISGSLYLPWEIYELARRQTWVRWTVLCINLAIVAYLIWLRVEMHKARQRNSGGHQPAVADLT